jgi:hypothetical protein
MLRVLRGCVGIGIVGAVLPFAGGCAMPGKDAWDAAVAKSETTLRERAAFDLSCATADLKVQALEEKTDQWGKRYMAVAGVAGCGRKATYVAHGDFQWLKNAETSPSEAK